MPARFPHVEAKWPGQGNQTWGTRKDDVHKDGWQKKWFAQYNGNAIDRKGDPIPNDTLDRILTFCIHIRGAHSHHHELFTLLEAFEALCRQVGRSKGGKPVLCMLKLPFPIAFPSGAYFPANRA